MVRKSYVVSEKLKIGAEVWSAGDVCPKMVILIFLSNVFAIPFN